MDLKELGLLHLRQLGINNYENWYDEFPIYIDNFPDLMYWNILPTKDLGIVEVPLKNVIGTDHISYGKGYTWLKNLGNLKKFKKWYTKKSFLDYFNSNINQGLGIYLYKFGNKYIIGGGNNRIHIAKFLNIPYLNLPVHEHFFDEEFFNLINRYIELGIPLNIPEKNLTRVYTWIINFKDILTIGLHGFDTLKKFLEIYESISLDWSTSFKTKIFLLFNSDSNKFKHIYVNNDFDLQTISLIRILKFNIFNNAKL